MAEDQFSPFSAYHLTSHPHALTVAYSLLLHLQLHLAAEETSWMDKHFASEQEKEWERRQAKWDAEASARNALLRDVATVRKHQVEDRARSKEEERARDAAQVSVWREQQAVANEREAAAQAERQRKLALQQSYTARQLAENEAARAAAIQATYLEARLAEKVERDYQSRVDALLRVSERVFGIEIRHKITHFRVFFESLRNLCPKKRCTHVRRLGCGDAQTNKQ
jgi:hypothetical protein